jgi:hypothetical protein
MPRQKSETERVHISMKIKEYILKYVKIKAATQSINTNILIEGAMVKLLDATRQMDKLDIYALVSSPIKSKRVPLTTMIDKNVLADTRAMAKRVDVAFAQVVETALVRYLSAELADLTSRKIIPRGDIENALIQLFRSDNLLDIQKTMEEVNKKNHRD